MLHCNIITIVFGDDWGAFGHALILCSTPLQLGIPPIPLPPDSRLPRRIGCVFFFAVQRVEFCVILMSPDVMMLSGVIRCGQAHEGNSWTVVDIKQQKQWLRSRVAWFFAHKPSPRHLFLQYDSRLAVVSN